MFVGGLEAFGGPGDPLVGGFKSEAGIMKGLANQLGATAATPLKGECGIKGFSTRAGTHALASHV